MRSKLNIFFSILFLCLGSGSNLIYAEEIRKKEIQSIPLNYLEQIPSNDYIIGPGDALQIIVSRFYPELTSEAMVDGEGTIRLPKLNRVYVEGLDLNELREILNKAYKKYVKYPTLEIDIIRYRPIRIFVEGEVENPGNHVLKGSYSSGLASTLNNKLQPTSRAQSRFIQNESNSNVTKDFFPSIFDAIRTSGGITQFADLSNIKIIRRNNLSNGGGKITASINLEKSLINGDSSQNIRIYDSDIIKIPKSSTSNRELLQKAISSNVTPRFSQVFVSGRVRSPGYIVMPKVGSLNDAIEMAGGTTSFFKGPITFIRFKNNGTIDKRKFRFSQRNNRGSYKNPYLKSGDLIVVGGSKLETTNQIIKEITNPIRGAFSTYGLIRSINEDD